MSKSEHFEILILGSGAGGKLLAWHMAESGRRTAVVERRYIGGSCPNINCLPSKNEIWSAEVAHLVLKPPSSAPWFRQNREVGSPAQARYGSSRDAHLQNYNTSMPLGFSHLQVDGRCNETLRRTTKRKRANASHQETIKVQKRVRHSSTSYDMTGVQDRGRPHAE